jgi:GNAT superfamily N-acetyltransferase
MPDYGKWKEKLTFDGELCSADLIEDSYAKLIDSVVRAAQVSDTPHTWRVKECSSESEVTPQMLEKGREVLARDQEVMHAHIVTYVGDPDGSGRSYRFLGAGAIRDKLTRDYQNDAYPVISRAVVAPSERGKGIGSLLVEHRMKAVLHRAGAKPKAIHFGTESQRIVHSAQNVERDEGIKYVYIGDEQYTSTDGTHTVHDYLCFLPWFQNELLAACDRLKQNSKTPALVDELKQNLAGFMQNGVKAVLGAKLRKSFETAAASIVATAKTAADLAMIQEIFVVKAKIGAEDPAPKKD